MTNLEGRIAQLEIAVKWLRDRLRASIDRTGSLRQNQQMQAGASYSDPVDPSGSGGGSGGSGASFGLAYLPDGSGNPAASSAPNLGGPGVVYNASVWILNSNGLGYTEYPSNTIRNISPNALTTGWHIVTTSTQGTSNGWIVLAPPQL